LRLFAKHVLHLTGRPCVGLNGTVVLLPHSEHVTRVSIRRRPPTPCFLALHCLQWLGSLVNAFSWKNCCSPAEKTNVVPQPIHRISRSAKDISPLSFDARRRKTESMANQALSDVASARLRDCLPESLSPELVKTLQ
jgi:hypothetical protein